MLLRLHAISSTPKISPRRSHSNVTIPFEDGTVKRSKSVGKASTIKSSLPVALLFHRTALHKRFADDAWDLPTNSIDYRYCRAHVKPSPGPLNSTSSIKWAFEETPTSLALSTRTSTTSSARQIAARGTTNAPSPRTSNR
jgi:hypothetical protein